MNLAIVIGVSEYENVNDLPGCQSDVDLISKLLEVTSKWDDVLTISKQTDSKSIKAKLSEFIKKHQDEKVHDVFFYFTGHGLFDGSEFYYVLSDFSDDKRKQTSLENAELDNLLRSLGAEITIKVVDACQSGTRYVKDPESFSKFLITAEKAFKKCYFYFSSNNDQYSYQTAKISDFTQGFVTAFIDRPNTEVRYKDIMDSLADRFEANTKQTPFFIMQGNYTETFGFVSQEATINLEISLGDIEDASEKEIRQPEMSLLERIVEDSKRYCTEAEAMDVISNLEAFCKKLDVPEEIKGLYDLNVQLEEDHPRDINIESVGKWFNSNTSGYFFEIITEKRIRKVPKATGLLAASMGFRAWIGDSDVPMVDEAYNAVIGAKSSVKLPFGHMLIRAFAKYPNIDETACIIFPFISETSINIFHCKFSYKKIDWNMKKIESSSAKWSNIQHELKQTEEIKKSVSELLNSFYEFTLAPIKNKFDYAITDKEENA